MAVPLAARLSTAAREERFVHRLWICKIVLSPHTNGPDIAQARKASQSGKPRQHPKGWPAVPARPRGLSVKSQQIVLSDDSADSRLPIEGTVGSVPVVIVNLAVTGLRPNSW